MPFAPPMTVTALQLQQILHRRHRLPTTVCFMALLSPQLALLLLLATYRIRVKQSVQRNLFTIPSLHWP